MLLKIYIICISKIPTHCLKETLITWPLSASGLLGIDNWTLGIWNSEMIYLSDHQKIASSMRNSQCPKQPLLNQLYVYLENFVYSNQYSFIVEVSEIAQQPCRKSSFYTRV